ncbi:hypothetical protein NIES208_13780 [[Limnothrix rosea] IAM M-220]|nr:hypothetical protein NIES208_13780 [[Limnothrix rosea] IAM M-220]
MIKAICNYVGGFVIFLCFELITSLFLSKSCYQWIKNIWFISKFFIGCEENYHHNFLDSAKVAFMVPL